MNRHSISKTLNGIMDNANQSPCGGVMYVEIKRNSNVKSTEVFLSPVPF
jgi:hypothetical protein